MNLKYLLLLSVLTPRTAEAFLSCPTTRLYRASRATGQFAQSADDEGQPRGKPSASAKQPDPLEAFMEQASRKGADKVKAMSIEERTRRAMLAEAVEDRIFSLYDDLEGLLKGGGPGSSEEQEEVTSLARQIKASQSQYENLVSGKPSSVLDLGTTPSNGDE